MTGAGRKVQSAAAVFAAALCMGAAVPAQQPGPAQRMADAAMHLWPGGRLAAPATPRQWTPGLGTLLDGMDALWANTADGRYFRYVQASIDPLIAPGGSISGWNDNARPLDVGLLGRQLLLLYEVTRQPKYYLAARRLRDQLAHRPRNPSGLGGLDMAEPFYAEWAADFHQPGDYAGIAPHFALPLHPRGMAWSMMAIVDTLPYISANTPQHAELLRMLRSEAAAVAHAQDARSGLWPRALSHPGAGRNNPQPSPSCIFVCALAKGVRLGYLPRAYLSNAHHGWQGILRNFVHEEPTGTLTLTGAPVAAGISIPPGSNAPGSVGAFLLAASEMDLAPNSALARGRVALLDAWFTSPTRTNAAGQTELYHYKWQDRANTGYSFLGHIFRGYGARTRTLAVPPTRQALRHAAIYIIASPDTERWNPHPHTITAAQAQTIAAWVKAGGVLVLFANDPANANIPELNQVAGLVGLHFNNVLVHHVIGDNFAMGSIRAPASPLFTQPRLIYMKDTCSIAPGKAVHPLLTWKGDTLLAFARYGRGTAVAVADPWLYNEYTDGRKLPPSFQNFAAGQDFVRWLLRQP